MGGAKDLWIKLKMKEEAAKAQLPSLVGELIEEVGELREEVRALRAAARVATPEAHELLAFPAPKAGPATDGKSLAAAEYHTDSGFPEKRAPDGPAPADAAAKKPIRPPSQMAKRIADRIRQNPGSPAKVIAGEVKMAERTFYRVMEELRPLGFHHIFGRGYFPPAG